MNRQKRADWMLVLATSFWGISNCLTAICLEELQPLTLNAFRFMAAFLVLGAANPKRVFRASRATLKYALVIGLCLVVVYLSTTFGIVYTSVSNVGFIGALPVLVTPLLEFAVYRRRPERKFGLCILLCLVGVAMLTLNEAFRPAVGDIICLAAPIVYAVDLMITERAVADPEVDPIALGVWEDLVVALVVLVFAFMTESPRLPTTPTVWLAAMFLGVFCSGICFIIQNIEQQFTSASHASLIFTLEPVFSAFFAFFLLHEHLTLRGYFGAALMLLSLILMETDTKKLSKREKIS